MDAADLKYTSGLIRAGGRVLEEIRYSPANIQYKVLQGSVTTLCVEHSEVARLLQKYTWYLLLFSLLDCDIVCCRLIGQ